MAAKLRKGYENGGGIVGTHRVRPKHFKLFKINNLAERKWGGIIGALVETR